MASNITRRKFIRTTSTSLLGLSSLNLLNCSGLNKKEQPNVLFIFADQLRRQALGCYGETNITTPNLDRLAGEGVKFTNAISSCPLCTPYRGMLQTGRYPSHTGIMMNWINPNPDEYCIAEAFRDNGYRTGFIGKWHLISGAFTANGTYKKWISDGKGGFKTDPEWNSKRRQLQRAYVEANPEPEYVPPGPYRQGYDHWEAYNFHVSFQKAFYYKDTPQRLFMPKYETDSEADMAMEFMKNSKNTNKPFFLMVAPHLPHNPWREKDCPEGYLEKVKKNLDKRPNVNNWLLPPNMTKGGHSARSYYAQIKNIDDNIGRLMSFLKENDLEKNTIVVFTSDHGEMLGSHSMKFKMKPYEESIGIPLIIRWPKRIPAGIVSDCIYTPIDHMSTLLPLADIEKPSKCDGMDLSSTVLGKNGVERKDTLIMNYTSDWDYCVTGKTDLAEEWRGVRTNTHTYVKYLEGREELFDNKNDPYQMTNLAADSQHSDKLNEMRRRLNELLKEAHDDFRLGDQYSEWFDDHRNVIKTGLGPIKG